MADQQGSVTFIAKQGTDTNSDAPPVQFDEVVQYVTSETGVVFQQGNGDTWYCCKPQVFNIAYQEDPLPYDADRDLSEVYYLSGEIGATDGTTYFCDVDVWGNDSSSEYRVNGFMLYLEIDGTIVSGNRFTFTTLQNQDFRYTARFYVEANPGNSIRLFGSVADSNYDGIRIYGGKMRVTRGYYLD